MTCLMTAKRRKLVIATVLTGIAVCLGLPLIQPLANRTIRWLSGFHIIGGPLPGRSREQLPAVVVESGRGLCCRMLCCDFRFPLPSNTRVANIEPVTGGFDTAKGTIYVTNSHGGMVDLADYARAIRRDGFSLDSIDGDSFAASSPDGGFVAAEGSAPCRITFSFFGDF